MMLCRLDQPCPAMHFTLKNRLLFPYFQENILQCILCIRFIFQVKHTKPVNHCTVGFIYTMKCLFCPFPHRFSPFLFLSYDIRSSKQKYPFLFGKFSAKVRTFCFLRKSAYFLFFSAKMRTFCFSPQKCVLFVCENVKTPVFLYDAAIFMHNIYFIQKKSVLKFQNRFDKLLYHSTNFL